MTTAYDASKTADNYPPGIEFGFWSLARHRVLIDALRFAAERGLRSADGPILEVGCGPGIVVSALREAGFDATGVELGQPEVRPSAQPFVRTGLRAESLPLAVRKKVQTILMLDVIEHVPDDEAFLEGVLGAFPNCTCAIVTVPARKEVWSNYDDYFGHFRRYDTASLTRVLKGANLEPVRIRYFFRALYFAALTLKLLGRRRRVQLSSPGVLPLQRLVASGFGLEQALLGWSPVPGLSLFAVARTGKPPLPREQSRS